MVLNNVISQVIACENQWSVRNFSVSQLGPTEDLVERDIKFINLLHYLGNSELSGYAMTYELHNHILKLKEPEDFSASLIYQSTVVVPDEFRHGLIAQAFYQYTLGVEKVTLSNQELFRCIHSKEHIWKNAYHALLSLMYSEIQNDTIYKLAKEYVSNSYLKEIYGHIRKDEIRHKMGFFREIQNLCKVKKHRKRFLKSLKTDIIGYQVKFHQDYAKTLAHTAYVFGTDSIVVNNTEFYDRCEKLFGVEYMPQVAKYDIMSQKHFLSINMDKVEYRNLHKQYRGIPNRGEHL
jgi:hypothetical protein